MYSLLSNSRIDVLVERELLPFSAALIIAQDVFRWGFFALEMIAFLALWFVISFLAVRAAGR